MKICSKGVWDETIPGIQFENTGISNYSRLMMNLMEAYPRGAEGAKKWSELSERIKLSGAVRNYDCVIGVSGGTDSCYLLYIAKEYGLRPLAVNLDNGWSSDIAVKNIKKVTSALNIDLETYVINYEEIKDLIRCYMTAGLPWIDIPTDLAIKSVLYKIASREGIKFILRGNDFRSEGSQPREWTYGDGKQLRYIHKKYGRIKLKTFPNYTKKDLLYFSLLKGIKSIYPYYYLDYSKKSAQAFLHERFGWEYYGGHHFENTFTRFAISCWLYDKFGIDKRKISLSAQVMNNEISRDDALIQLNSKPYLDSEKKDIIEFVLKKLDFSEEEYERIINSDNKSFLDYPSDYNFIDKAGILLNALFKQVFIHKPQSLFQAEMRKKNI